MGTKAIQTGMLDCGHDKKVVVPTYDNGTPITNGFATDADDKTMCYECAAEQDQKRIEAREEIFGYVSSDGKKITTWPGIFLMRVTGHWTGSGFYGYKTHYFNAVDVNGQEWYGKNGGHAGGEGCAIRMRPAKRKL